MLQKKTISISKFPCTESKISKLMCLWIRSSLNYASMTARCRSIWNSLSVLSLLVGLQCLFLCLSRERVPLNFALQMSHSRDGGKWCLLTWSNLLDADKNAFSQYSHSYGFSPVCNLVWYNKEVFETKHPPHSSHLNFFSKVCFTKCVSNLLGT